MKHTSNYRRLIHADWQTCKASPSSLNLVSSGQPKTVMIFEEVKIKIASAGTPSKACLLLRVFICQLDVHGNLRLCTNIFFDLNHFCMNAMKIVLMN